MVHQFRQMKNYIGLFFLLSSITTQATTYTSDTIKPITVNNRQWIAPAVLFSTGVLIASTPPLTQIEKSINREIEKTARKTHIDQATQFLPAVAVFALDAVGLQSENSTRKQIQLFGVSQLAAAAVVYPTKIIVRRERPNGSDKRSFPSGHATRAFVSAEFLHQEFGHLSPWISIAGYTTAGATAYLRMYSNEHWLGDVLVGAAIGMASTKLVYWVNKKIQSRPADNKALIASF